MPNLANGYKTTITGGITSSGTSCVVASTAGIPAVPFVAVILADGANTDEIVLVTANASGTLTITRAYELMAGVGASAHGVGATLAAIVSAGELSPLISPLGAGSLIQSLAWATVANGGTRTWGSTPIAGNTLYCFHVSNQHALTSITQTNVTWTKIGRTIIAGGNIGVAEIWMGVVAASPGSVTTFNFVGNNVQAVILQEYNSLTAVDAAQSWTPYSTTGIYMTNHTFVWPSLGGRAFLLAQNSTGGAPSTPAGWTASTGTPFNYGGSGHGALYTIDASVGSGLYAAHAYIEPIAADNHADMFMHAKP